MKCKRSRRKIIEANAIQLYDATGKLRIALDAGDDSGYASINLFSITGASIQVASQPDGSVAVPLLGRRGKAHATLVLSHNEAAELHLSDRDGKLGTRLGALPDDAHRLVLFDRGQPYWSTPRLKKRKIAKRKRTK